MHKNLQIHNNYRKIWVLVLAVFTCKE